MSPPDPKPQKAPKRPPRRAGVDSSVSPPEGFRRRVYERTGPRCLVCGNHSPLPEASVGLFDPAHLIPAQMIRTEARTVPALADYVYDARIAAWACRGCHFANDYPGPDGPTITRDLLKTREDLWGVPLAQSLAEVVAEMDREVIQAGGPHRTPFLAYIESKYP